MRFCKLGRAVLSDDAFQVIIFVSWLVLMFVLVVCVGMLGSGGGWEYSLIFSKHLRDSLINVIGRKGNFL